MRDAREISNLLEEVMYEDPWWERSWRTRLMTLLGLPEDWDRLLPNDDAEALEGYRVHLMEHEFTADIYAMVQIVDSMLRSLRDRHLQLLVEAHESESATKTEASRSKIIVRFALSLYFRIQQPRFCRPGPGPVVLNVGHRSRLSELTFLWRWFRFVPAITPSHLSSILDSYKDSIMPRGLRNSDLSDQLARAQFLFFRGATALISALNDKRDCDQHKKEVDECLEQCARALKLDAKWGPQEYVVQRKLENSYVVSFNFVCHHILPSMYYCPAHIVLTFTTLLTFRDRSHSSGYTYLSHKDWTTYTVSGSNERTAVLLNQQGVKPFEITGVQFTLATFKGEVTRLAAPGPGGSPGGLANVYLKDRDSKDSTLFELTFFMSHAPKGWRVGTHGDFFMNVTSAFGVQLFPVNPKFGHDTEPRPAPVRWDRGGFNRGVVLVVDEDSQTVIFSHAGGLDSRADEVCFAKSNRDDFIYDEDPVPGDVYEFLVKASKYAYVVHHIPSTVVDVNVTVHAPR